MYVEIMLGISLGCFVNAFLFAVVNPIHAISWGLVGAVCLFTIRNRSTKADETLGEIRIASTKGRVK